MNISKYRNDKNIPYYLCINVSDKINLFTTDRLNPISFLNQRCLNLSKVKRTYEILLPWYHSTISEDHKTSEENELSLNV